MALPEQSAKISASTKLIPSEIRLSWLTVGSVTIMRASKILSSGSIINITDQVAVIEIPMNGSYAIPLEIIEPRGADIMAWTFVGFSGPGATDPSCLIVLAARDKGVFVDLLSVTICTHTGDRCVAMTPRSTPLSRVETSVVAKTIVSSLRSESLTHFSALIPILGAGLDTILADEAESAVSIRRGDSTDAWLVHRIDFVPNYIILRSSAGYACGPITSVRFHAQNRAVMTLTTGVPLDIQSVSGSILSGPGQYVAARFIEAI
jgi:hypothetical protein